METRDYSAKELQDDVPAEAYILYPGEVLDIPNYKFPEDSLEGKCLQLDGCGGFSRHDFDCPKFVDYSFAGGVW